MEANINDLSPFLDIIREAGMNETENFYLNLSGTSVISGLVKYLMDTEGSPLEKFLKRIEESYGLFKILLSVSREIFQHALTIGHQRMVTFLKASGISFYYRLEDRLFDKAIENDWLELVCYLYEIHVDPENYTIERDPVVIASITGNYNMMDRLLAANVRIFWTLHGTYPLVCSFESKEFKSTDEKLKFIDKYWGERLRTEIKVFRFENDPYVYGMKEKDMQIIDYLVKKGVRPTETALDKAVKNDNLEMVKIIHERCGLDFATTHLDMACEMESIKLIEYILIDEMFDPELKTGKLDQFILQNNFKLVQCFLDCGIKPSERTFLNTLRNELFEMSKLLVDSGVNTKYCDYMTEFKFQSLRNADESRIIEILEYILKLGVNISLGQLCLNDDNLPVIKLLVQFGAKINSHNTLLKASYYGCSDIVKFLLRNGADPRVVSKKNIK